MPTDDIRWCHTAYEQETHAIRCRNKRYYEQKNIVSRVLVGCSTLVDNSEAMRVPFDTYTRFFVLVELNDPGEPAVS